MTMMLSLYCPVCFKEGKHKESIQTRLAITVYDICTDSIFDLDGREPIGNEEEKARLDDERIICEVESKRHKCDLCGFSFTSKRTDPNFTGA
ncbi:hypothetical protein LCGC14_1845730 [marine sediment metagenome]|uniref:C2H2-type domain-containing protein n=1 Tax=marine sediment metagenome TaxID=412755 RepID=A0A0F9H066_9ZZZZ